MCYSAQVWTDYKRYVRQFGAEVDIKEFMRLYTKRQEDPKMRIPRGMDISFLNPKSPDEKQIRGLIDECNATQISDSEQELFKQVKRLADAERTSPLRTSPVHNRGRECRFGPALPRRLAAAAARLGPDPKRV